MMKRNPEYTVSARQSGAVLVVAMIVLLILLVIGLAGGRLVQTEEAMSGNFYDRSLAFQAAETALREGEERILTFDYNANGSETGTAVNLVYNCITNENGGLKCTARPDPYDPFGSGLKEDRPGSNIPWLDIDAGAALSGLNQDLPPQYYIDRLTVYLDTDATGSSRDASSYQYGKSGRTVANIIYRVTARSHDPDDADGAGRALVVLQSLVRREVGASAP